ncbi:MAG: M48 family metallopeptidase [Pseudomonadota bacterium]
MTVIRIGATPELFEGRGILFDGESAAPLKAGLRIDEEAEALVIAVDGREDFTTWPLSDIRQVRDQAEADMMVLRRRDDPVTRLILTGGEDQRIARLRATDLRRAPPVEGKGRLALWGGASLASVAAMIFFLIPFLADNLAGFLPPAGQRALGETVLGDVREAFGDSAMAPLAFCEAEAGEAALAAMGAALFPEPAVDRDLLVYVLDSDMVNAFALPGGIIVFMRGLLEEAENAQEIAAVYAHEVGHVVARDPSRMALRSAGSVGVLGLLLGDFAGGAVVLFLTNRLIAANYSQEAEAAADAFSHDVLLRAGIRPDAMAAFFERLRDEFGEAPGLVQQFLTHPAFEDRIAAARAATPEGMEDRPILTDAQWTALKAICES